VLYIRRHFVTIPPMGGSDHSHDALRSDEKDFLLDVAWRSIGAAVRDEPGPVFTAPGGRLRRPAGAFCTLTTRGELRGCVGFFEPVHPLVETVARASAKAALEDRRFSPVTEPELPAIGVELSVLSEKVAVRSEGEIQIGRDGLYVEAPSGRGLLLPQVAGENGWDVGTFVRQVFRKGGIPPAPLDDPGISVYRFSAQVFSRTAGAG